MDSRTVSALFVNDNILPNYKYVLPEGLGLQNHPVSLLVSNNIIEGDATIEQAGRDDSVTLVNTQVCASTTISSRDVLISKCDLGVGPPASDAGTTIPGADAARRTTAVAAVASVQCPDGSATVVSSSVHSCAIYNADMVNLIYSSFERLEIVNCNVVVLNRCAVANLDIKSCRVVKSFSSTIKLHSAVDCANFEVNKE